MKNLKTMDEYINENVNIEMEDDSTICFDDDDDELKIAQQKIIKFIDTHFGGDVYNFVNGLGVDDEIQAISGLVISVLGDDIDKIKLPKTLVDANKQVVDNCKKDMFNLMIRFTSHMILDYYLDKERASQSTSEMKIVKDMDEFLNESYNVRVPDNGYVIIDDTNNEQEEIKRNVISLIDSVFDGDIDKLKLYIDKENRCDMDLNQVIVGLVKRLMIKDLNDVVIEDIETSIKTDNLTKAKESVLDILANTTSQLVIDHYTKKKE